MKLWIIYFLENKSQNKNISNYILAHYYYELGDHTKATQKLNQVIIYDFIDFTIRENLGNLACKLGYKEQAMHIYNNIIAYSEDEIKVNNARNNILKPCKRE